jgi:hypothetical protein
VQPRRRRRDVDDLTHEEHAEARTQRQEDAGRHRGEARQARPEVLEGQPRERPLKAAQRQQVAHVVEVRSPPDHRPEEQVVERQRHESSEVQAPGEVATRGRGRERVGPPHRHRHVHGPRRAHAHMHLEPLTPLEGQPEHEGRRLEVAAGERSMVARAPHAWGPARRPGEDGHVVEERIAELEQPAGLGRPHELEVEPQPESRGRVAEVESWGPRHESVRDRADDLRVTQRAPGILEQPHGRARLDARPRVAERHDARGPLRGPPAWRRPRSLRRARRQKRSDDDPDCPVTRHAASLTRSGQARLTRADGPRAPSPRAREPNVVGGKLHGHYTPARLC